MAFIVVYDANVLYPKHAPGPADPRQPGLPGAGQVDR